MSSILKRHCQGRLPGDADVIPHFYGERVGGTCPVVVTPGMVGEYDGWQRKYSEREQNGEQQTSSGEPMH